MVPTINATALFFFSLAARQGGFIRRPFSRQCQVYRSLLFHFGHAIPDTMGKSCTKRGSMSVPLLSTTRNGVVERLERGHCVIVDDSGSVIWSKGDPDHVTFMRSAAKPL